jgi:hypothetical protein
MTLICVAVFIVFMAIRPAKAQWTPWGWQHSMAAYGPLRVPPGFRAPAIAGNPPPAHGRIDRVA